MLTSNSVSILRRLKLLTPDATGVVQNQNRCQQMPGVIPPVVLYWPRQGRGCRMRARHPLLVESDRPKALRVLHVGKIDRDELKHALIAQCDFAILDLSSRACAPSRPRRPSTSPSFVEFDIHTGETPDEANLFASTSGEGYVYRGFGSKN